MKIAKLLSHGQQNAIPLRHLARITGLDGRTVRQMIENERRSGTPICADNSTGYFLAATDEELTRFKRNMEHRAGEIMQTAKAMKWEGR